MGEQKAVELFKRVGFPHARVRAYHHEVPREAYPEIPETEDSLTKLGESIGRSNRGRTRLPQMTTSRLRGSKEGEQGVTAERS